MLLKDYLDDLLSRVGKLTMDATSLKENLVSEIDTIVALLREHNNRKLKKGPDDQNIKEGGTNYPEAPKYQRNLKDLKI